MLSVNTRSQVKQLYSHVIEYLAAAQAASRACSLVNSSVTVGSALTDSLLKQIYQVIHPRPNVERELPSLGRIPLVLFIFPDPGRRTCRSLVA